MLEHPEPHLFLTPSPSANTHRTHPDAHKHTHLHSRRHTEAREFIMSTPSCVPFRTHTQDSPAASPSASHTLDLPQKQHVSGQILPLSTAPEAASLHPELLEGAPRAGLQCPSPVPADRAAGLMEARMARAVEVAGRKQSQLFCQNVTMTITPCSHCWCCPPSPRLPSSGALEEAGGHLAAFANSCWD